MYNAVGWTTIAVFMLFVVATCKMVKAMVDDKGKEAGTSFTCALLFGWICYCLGWAMTYIAPHFKS